jgi:DNA mismatch endonuclease (patch repair protein)
MSRIRGRDTKPERILRRLLWHSGLRYRLHARTPAGRPDVVFPGARVAVFVDGCFWHGCPDHYVRPRSSIRFWAEKLTQNVERDTRQTHRLEDAGWRVCRVWEHEVFEDPDRVVSRITSAVRDHPWRSRRSWRVYRVVELDHATDRERRYLRDLRDTTCRRTMTRKRSTRKWQVSSRAIDPLPASM